MNVDEIFGILGIEETRDEDEIRAAYRKLLLAANPEDDAEGFKRLRRAYEEAVEYARTPANEEIQRAEWMEESGPDDRGEGLCTRYRFRLRAALSGRE